MTVTMNALGVSPGFALGPVLVLDRKDQADPGRRAAPGSDGRQTITEALAKAAADLLDLRDRALGTLGQVQADIFEAHLAMVRDPELLGAIEGHLAENWDAPTAVWRACQTFIDLLSGLEEEGQRSRAEDLRDLRRRILGYLDSGTQGPAMAGPGGGARGPGPWILVADDLTPSETISLDPCRILGFLTASGSRTSHASILARSLGLPAATGAGEILARVKTGQLLALDGSTGEVVLDPDDGQKARFSAARARDEGLKAQRLRYAALPTRTKDGAFLDLAANIGRLEDLAAVTANGAEGVGLFRTEFLFLDRNRAPTEDEQTAVYTHVLERMAGKPVVIRTLDIGGDKQIPYLPQPPESNPFLGVRAVRLCLEKQDLFRTQIRALLRASTAGNLRVMVPMVALVEEILAVRELFAEETAALECRGLPHGPYQLGVMVEIPAAALNAPALAEAADFFSLGTNDLVQYTMAADRMSDRLAHLYQPLHPSVLRLIDLTVKGARNRHRWVGVCGEMASDPAAAVVLLGLGVDELSLSAAGIPGLRALITRVDRTRAAETARLALQLGTSGAVLDLVHSRHPEIEETIGVNP